MDRQTKQTVAAATTMLGAIVGVGIFGVPHVLSRVGVLPALGFFAALTVIQTLQHLFFTEAAIACPEDHGLPGLARKYLGRAAGRIGGLALALGYWASLTAYVAVGGIFLSVILSPVLGGGPVVYAAVWAVLGGLAVRYGVNFVSRIEVIGTAALMLALFGILGAALPHVEIANLPAVNWLDPVLPYGVILFSLSGLTAIPEMEGLVGGRPRDYRRAVVAGTLAASLVTMAFGFIVWGVVGDQVTEDAILGLQSVLGSGLAVPAAVAGFLAVATSYFATALNLKESFRNDFSVNGTLSWLAVAVPPLVIFLLGGRNFLTMIGLSGAVFGGVLAVLVGLLYLKIRRNGLVRESPLRVPAPLAILTMAVLALGILAELGDVIAGAFR